MKLAYFLATVAIGLLVSSTASAAFLVEAHQSGLAWENFMFGGDTFSAGSSNAASDAVGLTAETSIYGGDGLAFPDTYIFSYTPGEDDDNVSFVADTILGSQDGSPGLGHRATGLEGGPDGKYNVYITIPSTSNVSGGPPTITITQEGDPIIIDDLDQNNGGTGEDTQINPDPDQPFVGGMNNAWYLLGTVDYLAGTTYTVTMEAGTNSFVSQRAHGVMWEYTLDDDTLLGDFNDNGILDAEDIDILSTAIRNGLTDSLFDVNSDGDVDNQDREHWVKELRNTWFGDANMDDQFDTADIISVLAFGEYEDGVPLNSGWATGDWNGDAEFGTGDVILALSDGGYELGPPAEVQAVPEPAGWLLLVFTAIPLAMRRRLS